MLSPDVARIRSFKVVPSLPKPLEPLLDIANNIWWSWHPEAVDLFVRLDRNLWHKYNHNPVRMLGNCPQETLDEAARDEGFLTSMRHVFETLQGHLVRTPWHTTLKQDTDNLSIAYFCAEFGLTECLPIYSGGLGCLAGDHLKSAAELGVPLVGVGLLYRHGYFQQYLNADGWQQEYYPDLDFSTLPISRVRDDSGRQIKVSVQLPGRDVHIGVWKVRVGRIDLYLLDTNVPENDEADRAITGQLYGGDMETRIKQEIVLGIGGVRALSACGIEPNVFHMNEGHSAFLALERIRTLIEKYNVTFDEARQFIAAGNIFTTHTPVPAGIDRFPPEMIQRYFSHYHGSLHLDMEGLLALGRENVYAQNEFFSMAILAIRTADWANGVSRLHGQVSRAMWRNIWPGISQSEVPITHVTNGVHARSWLSKDLIYLLDRYLGSRWQNKPADQSVWQAVADLPDEELWRVHTNSRHRLVLWTRRNLCRQLEARGTNPKQAREIADQLDPNALTIGFARRFATYKRANLLLRDSDRLMRMLTDADRPIQFIIAGKAHPADGGGKDLIREMVHFSRNSDAGHKIVFVENYDIHVARYLVQGCDVWLNTPRRGMEASGTSGMKAALNGVLNCSVMDGWWDEAYDTDLGWSIGRGETYSNLDVQDDIESQSLYNLLEQHIIPVFYDRADHGLPRNWVARMKKCIATLAPLFNTNRMVKQYTEQLYLPSFHRAGLLGQDNLKAAVALAHQKERLRAAWGHMNIEDVQAETAIPMGVGQRLDLNAVVHLGELKPEEVRVQVHIGILDNDGQIIEGYTQDLSHLEELGDGRYRFGGAISPDTSGRHGFALRIVPGGKSFEGIVSPGLIKWEQFPQAQPSAAAPPTNVGVKV